MGMLDWLTGGPATPPPPTAAQRAQAAAAQARARQAQLDAQARLSPAPTPRTATLPCGLPITVQPCDLKDLELTERKSARGERARRAGDADAEERTLPAQFVVLTRGQRDRNPYITGTIIEVTGGIAAEHPKTSIDLVIGEDYQFCSQNTHPHLIITQPDGTTAVHRGVKRHSMEVFRRPRATDGLAGRSFVDLWPARWGFQDYRISALVCGSRQGGSAVRSQNTVVRVFPNDQWELEITAPSLFSTTVQRTSDIRAGTTTTRVEATVNLPRSSATAGAQWDRGPEGRVFTGNIGTQSAGGGERSAVDYRYTNDRGAVRQEMSRSYTDSRTGAGFALDSQATGRRELGPDSYRAIAAAPQPVSTRVTAELKHNGTSVATLANIVAAINAIKSIGDTIKAIYDQIMAMKPKVGFDFQFGVELFTGSLKATWGFKEFTDHRVFYAFSLYVSIVLLKLKMSLAFGVDLTIRGYGFVANIEGKIEGSIAVGALIERKKPADPEWSATKFKGDVPATITARGMAIEDRILTFRGVVESGFEAEGEVTVDAQGLGVNVEKIEFKGLLLKGRATVISWFDVDGEYRVLHKRQVGGPMRIPG